MTKELEWYVRKRPGIDAKFASQEESLEVGVTDSLILDLGDYRFVIRRSEEGLLVSTERGDLRVVKGPRMALQISQPNQIVLWAEFSSEPNKSRYR